MQWLELRKREIKKIIIEMRKKAPWFDRRDGGTGEEEK